MKGNINLIVVLIILLGLIFSGNLRAEEFWQTQFDTTKSNVTSVDSILSLDDVLSHVASNNLAFLSFSYQLKASKGSLKQAELRANPELSAEIEDVGWDSPGLKESELSVSLSQKFEFFGQRGARINVAEVEIDATKLQIRLAAFDLYLETKQRFYALVHAQNNMILSQTSVALAKEIVENITFRIEKGVALQSELLLAQLEKQRANLSLDQAQQEVIAFGTLLVSLWNGTLNGLKVTTNPEPEFKVIQNQMISITDQIDSTRIVTQMLNESEILRAMNNLAKAESKPTITFNSGFKRFESDNSKSLLFGVSMPIPFFNRNQGTRQSLTAQRRALDYDIEQKRIETAANIQAHTIRLIKLIESHAAIDSMLLPTAEEAYQILLNAYEVGRVPYTQLLEAERSLNDLNFEHNDILLAIHNQIIDLEQVSGIALREDKEN